MAPLPFGYRAFKNFAEPIYIGSESEAQQPFTDRSILPGETVNIFRYLDGEHSSVARVHCETSEMTSALNAATSSPSPASGISGCVCPDSTDWLNFLMEVLQFCWPLVVYLLFRMSAFLKRKFVRVIEPEENGHGESEQQQREASEAGKLKGKVPKLETDSDPDPHRDLMGAAPTPCFLPATAGEGELFLPSHHAEFMRCELKKEEFNKNAVRVIESLIGRLKLKHGPGGRLLDNRTLDLMDNLVVLMCSGSEFPPSQRNGYNTKTGGGLGNFGYNGGQQQQQQNRFVVGVGGSGSSRTSSTSSTIEPAEHCLSSLALEDAITIFKGQLDQYQNSAHGAPSAPGLQPCRL